MRQRKEPEEPKVLARLPSLPMLRHEFFDPTETPEEEDMYISPVKKTRARRSPRPMPFKSLLWKSKKTLEEGNKHPSRPKQKSSDSLRSHTQSKVKHTKDDLYKPAIQTKRRPRKGVIHGLKVCQLNNPSHILRLSLLQQPMIVCLKHTRTQLKKTILIYSDSNFKHSGRRITPESFQIHSRE